MYEQSYQIEQKKFMSLNRKLGLLPINLGFLVRLVIKIMFKIYHAPRRPNVSPHLCIRSARIFRHCKCYCPDISCLPFQIQALSCYALFNLLQYFIYPFSLQADEQSFYMCMIACKCSIMDLSTILHYPVKNSGASVTVICNCTIGTIFFAT